MKILKRMNQPTNLIKHLLNVPFPVLTRKNINPSNLFNYQTYSEISKGSYYNYDNDIDVERVFDIIEKR